MNNFNLLLKEIKLFSKQNWWIYIIFIICLFVIYKTNSGNLLEVSIVFLIHFFGDICVMLMGDFFSKNENKKALLAQIGSFIIFGGIGIYAGITAGKWSYLVPQLLFFWPIVKGFKQDIKWLNSYFMIVVGIFVLFGYYYLGLIKSLSIFIQILGFIIFPISLILTKNSYKYFGSLVGIGFIFLGSALLLYNGFIEKNVIGTDLSYTLLPFTVFIYYLKLIKKYI
ncbi:MAG: hypothetical protein QM490_01705 [Candidatus Gracilibacteria bacterium]